MKITIIYDNTTFRKDLQPDWGFSAMGHILGTARQFGEVYAIIGGMHGFSEFELFRDLKIFYPTHCTQHKTELKKLYPQKYIEGGAGRIIEI